MFTRYNFCHVLSVLLVSCTAVTLLLSTVSSAQTKPVTVTITEVTDINLDLDGDVFPSAGDFYAVAIINGTKQDTFANHFSFGDLTSGYPVPFGPLVPDPLWVMTQEVPSTSGTVPVLIQIWDSDDNIFDDDDDQADINPLSGHYTLRLEVDLATGKWTGDVNWPQRCAEGADERIVKVCFDISVLSTSGDLDGDGLLDSWEQYGFNADLDGTIDVNLPAFGANPRRKDVFVEVDCLVATNHSHCPGAATMSNVVRAFVNAPVANPDGTTGVQLHVDTGPLLGAGTIFPVSGPGGVTGTVGDFGGGGQQIAEAGNEIIEAFTNPKGSATKFHTLREAFFDSRRNLLFRYAIFGHQINSRRATNDCTSGEARTIPGNEFIVTLGGVKPDGNPCWDTVNGFSVGSVREQTGTFMHELGHTLGLFHGGDEPEVNDKPNYLSVMNYTFQTKDIPASPNGVVPGGVDYSRIALPPLVPASLNETTLDECAGIDAGQLGFGSRKWNDGNVLEGVTCPAPNTANVQADINNDGKLTSLAGFNDWPNLIYSLLDIAGAGSDGSLPPGEEEADPEAIQQSVDFMATMAAPGVVVEKTGPATAKPGDLVQYTTQIRNQGRGPALNVILTDKRPDGGTQVEDLNAVVVGGLVTRTSNFTVPLNACPGDFTSASAAVKFKDMVSNELAASGSAPLQIFDVAAPTLTVTLSPTTLWAPNHKFQEVTATITVTDNCDPNPAVTLVSVVSNEPETDFLGNGDKGPDIDGATVGTDDRAFSLRSERGTGGQSTGRVYSITYRATDKSGNTKDTVATVTVPTSNSGH